MDTISRNKRFFKREYTDKRDIAHLYFSIITLSHGIKISNRELDLLAHISIVGNIASQNSIKSFIEVFESSRASIYNLISKLTKKGLLIKKDKKMNINPQIALDFINNDKFIMGVKCMFKDKTLENK